MPDIKLKEKSIIKQLDKKVVQTQNFKNNLVTTKERLNEFTSKKKILQQKIMQVIIFKMI